MTTNGKHYPNGQINGHHREMIAVDRHDTEHRAMVQLYERDREGWHRLRGMLAQLALAPLHGHNTREVEIEITSGMWTTIDKADYTSEGLSVSRAGADPSAARVEWFFRALDGIPQWRPIRPARRPYLEIESTDDDREGGS